MEASVLENFYRTAFDTAPLAIVLADPENRVLEANPAFLRMFGYPASELQRLRLEDLIHADGRREFDMRVRSVIEGATEGFKTETRCAARDGRSFRVSVAAAAMRGADGRLCCWMRLLEDIPEWIQADEELQSRADHGRHAGKRNAAETLAGSIAHDFNNLMAGIQGSVSLLLLDKPADHRDVPYLKKIETLVEQASELTRRLAGSDPIPKYREEKDGLNDGIDTDAGILDRTPREACASDDAATEPGLAETAELTRKSILLVEDEEIVASIGEKMLSRLGYRVLVARNGNEALELYVQHRSEIELVILDMVMPGMAGGEIFDRLKSINPRIAVLLSSGYSLNGQTLEILRRGCRGFIQKPFNLEQLQQQISAILSGH